MTKSNKPYFLPPVFQQWLKYAVNHGELQDVIDMALTQQKTLQSLDAIKINGETEGSFYAWQKTYAAWDKEQGIDKFGNKPSDYTNTGSVNDTFHAQSIGWKHP